jgi:hypothetical protein
MLKHFVIAFGAAAVAGACSYLKDSFEEKDPVSSFRAVCPTRFTMLEAAPLHRELARHLYVIHNHLSQVIVNLDGILHQIVHSQVPDDTKDMDPASNPADVGSMIEMEMLQQLHFFITDYRYLAYVANKELEHEKTHRAKEQEITRLFSGEEKNDALKRMIKSREATISCLLYFLGTEREMHENFLEHVKEQRSLESKEKAKDVKGSITESQAKSGHSAFGKSCNFIHTYLHDLYNEARENTLQSM